MKKEILTIIIVPIIVICWLIPLSGKEKQKEFMVNNAKVIARGERPSLSGSYLDLYIEVKVKLKNGKEKTLLINYVDEKATLPEVNVRYNFKYSQHDIHGLIWETKENGSSDKKSKDVKNAKVITKISDLKGKVLYSFKQ